MTTVLVAYSSRYGGTAEIADAIGRVLGERGLRVDVAGAASVKSVEPYDAVVLGSAVYYGHWLEDVRDLIERERAALAARPVWLFSSGPLGPPDHLLPEGEPVDVGALLAGTSAVEHRVFPGRLDRSLLKLRERAMVAALHAPAGDFRDWEAIAAWAEEIASRVTASARGAVR